MKTFFTLLLILLFPVFSFSQIYGDEIESGEIAIYTKHKVKSRTKIEKRGIFRKWKSTIEYEYEPNIFIKKVREDIGFNHLQKAYYTDDIKIDSIIYTDGDGYVDKSYPKTNNNRDFVKYTNWVFDSLTYNYSKLMIRSVEYPEQNRVVIDTFGSKNTKFHIEDNMIIDITDLFYRGVATTIYHYDENGLLVNQQSFFAKNKTCHLQEVTTASYYFYDANNFLIKSRYFTHFILMEGKYYRPQFVYETNYKTNDKGLIIATKTTKYYIKDSSGERERIERFRKIKYRYDY